MENNLFGFISKLRKNNNAKAESNQYSGSQGVRDSMQRVSLQQETGRVTPPFMTRRPQPSSDTMFSREKSTQHDSIGLTPPKKGHWQDKMFGTDRATTVDVLGRLGAALNPEGPFARAGLVFSDLAREKKQKYEDEKDAFTKRRQTLFDERTKWREKRGFEAFKSMLPGRGGKTAWADFRDSFANRINEDTNKPFTIEEILGRYKSLGKNSSGSGKSSIWGDFKSGYSGKINPKTNKEYTLPEIHGLYKESGKKNTGEDLEGEIRATVLSEGGRYDPDKQHISLQDKAAASKIEAQLSQKGISYKRRDDEDGTSFFLADTKSKAPGMQVPKGAEPFYANHKTKGRMLLYKDEKGVLYDSKGGLLGGQGKKNVAKPKPKPKQVVRGKIVDPKKAKTRRAFAKKNI
jgi:hypothetical protein